MGANANTIAAVAALAVAFVALLVAFAQALQQYLVSGQLIRICDSVVYGKLPGQGHRIWQFSQFRFRIVYSIPQIGLSPSLWLGISSHVRASKNPSEHLPNLITSDLRKNQSVIAGEASWVSFTRTIQHSCDQSLRYTMVEGDADRCPADLPVVPMQLSMRDVVVAAIMAGMDCTDVSFQSQSLSMQGEAGTITSSRHPVLGALIHFAPKQTLQSHGIRTSNGTVNPQWVARMVGSMTVAGCKFDLRDRKHFEEDESSWIESARANNVAKSKGTMVLSDSSTLRQRRNPRPEISDLADQKPTVDALSTASTTDLHRLQDGAWSFSGVMDERLMKLNELQEGQSGPPSSSQVTWLNRLDRMRLVLWHALRKATSSRSSASATETLPVSEPKKKYSQPMEWQAVNRQPVIDPRSEDRTLFLMNTAPWPPAQTHLRRGNLTAYVADGRRLESTQPSDGKETRPKGHQLLLTGKDNTDRYKKSSQETVDEGLVEQSRDNARTEHVVNKWQRIFRQRRKNRSRGGSRPNGAAISRSGGPRRQSITALSRGTVAPNKSNATTRNRQLRIKENHNGTSSASYAGLSSSDSEARQQNYSRVTERSGWSDSEVSSSDYKDAGHSPRRGRRRNSSLGRERTRSKLLVYGHTPLRSKYSPPSAGNSHQLAKPGSLENKKQERRVRIVPPNDRAESDDDTVSSMDSLHRMDVDIDSPSNSRSRLGAGTASPANSPRRVAEPKSILRQPTERFLEEAHPIREGVTPRNPTAHGIPEGAKWTRINRKLVNPEALDSGNERYEERTDFVIVLRVLSKEEIQQYALKTQEIRGLRGIKTNNNGSSSSTEQNSQPDDEGTSSGGSYKLRASFQKGPYQNTGGAVEEEVEKQLLKRGRTKFPKRLVNKQALYELGYPFEEEEDSIIMRKALTKEHIDEIIEMSKEMNEHQSDEAIPQLNTEPIEGLASLQQSDHIERHSTGIFRGTPKNETSNDSRTSTSTDPDVFDGNGIRAHQQSLDLIEQPLSYEEELIFIKSESVLKRARESTEQCKDIILTLKFFTDNQPSVSSTEIDDICQHVQASNALLKRCLMIMEPLRNQKKIAAFVGTEVDVLVCGLRVCFNAFERRFGLFEITPLDFDGRQRALDDLLSTFAVQYSCTLLEHLGVSCRFGQEIIANLNAGILSSPESNLLRSRLCQMSNFSKSSKDPTSPKTHLQFSPPHFIERSRFLRSPSRFTQSPSASMENDRRHERPKYHRIGPHGPRKSKSYKEIATQGRESPRWDRDRHSDSLASEDLTNSDGQISTDSTLAEPKPNPTGEMNWLWISQTDVIPGYLATPWKTNFSEDICIGAISVLLSILERFTDSSNCGYVDSQGRCQAWIEAGRSTFPSYAHNSHGGVVVSGVYEPVRFTSLEAQIPPIELLYSYKHQVDHAYFHSTDIVRENLGELMGLDSWLSICGRLPEVSDGPTNLLRTLPTLVQRIMTEFNLEFSSFDRTSSDGGLRIIQTIADSLLQLFMEQGLSAAEQLFTTVALLRTAKMALCVARGSDTSTLRDVLVHDVQVYMA